MITRVISVLLAPALSMVGWGQHALLIGYDGFLKKENKSYEFAANDVSSMGDFSNKWNPNSIITKLTTNVTRDRIFSELDKLGKASTTSSLIYFSTAGTSVNGFPALVTASSPILVSEIRDWIDFQKKAKPNIQWTLIVDAGFDQMVNLSTRTMYSGLPHVDTAKFVGTGSVTEGIPAIPCAALFSSDISTKSDFSISYILADPKNGCESAFTKILTRNFERIIKSHQSLRAGTLYDEIRASICGAQFCNYLPNMTPYFEEGNGVRLQPLGSPKQKEWAGAPYRVYVDVNEKSIKKDGESIRKNALAELEKLRGTAPITFSVMPSEPADRILQLQDSDTFSANESKSDTGTSYTRIAGDGKPTWTNLVAELTSEALAKKIFDLTESEGVAPDLTRKVSYLQNGEKPTEIFFKSDYWQIRLESLPYPRCLAFIFDRSAASGFTRLVGPVSTAPDTAGVAPLIYPSKSVAKPTLTGFQQRGVPEKLFTRIILVESSDPMDPLDFVNQVAFDKSRQNAYLMDLAKALKSGQRRWSWIEGSYELREQTR